MQNVECLDKVARPHDLAPLVAWLGICTVLGLLYRESLFDMVSVWLRSDTFAHGMVVVPLAGWLAWRQREALRDLPWRCDYRALVALAGLATVWALAEGAGVMVVQQFSVVGMLATLVWLVFGPAVLAAAAFPLGFLFLAVPAGEFLIPYLVDLTAWFTVHAIRLTGIPIYVEGNTFLLPTGSWSVVSACSGIRYLMATVTVSLLFAYLNYRSLWRRTAFVLAGACVALLGNGLRAFGIVMLGHLSNQRLAVGFDHLIYGWLFFGVIIFVLFAIGARWREDDIEPPVVRAPPGVRTRPRREHLVLAALAAVAIAAIWPAIGAWRTAPDPAQWASLSLPAAEAGWQRADDVSTEWRPRYVGHDQMLHAEYRQGELRAGVFVAYYPVQVQGAEVVNSRNVLVHERDRRWKVVERSRQRREVGGAAHGLERILLTADHQALVVWRWVWVDGWRVPNRFVAKAVEAVNELLRGRSSGAALMFYLVLPDDDPQAEPAAFGQLVDALGRHVEAQLASNAEEPGP